MNDFYPIYKMKLKPWIKYWVLKKLNDSGESTLKVVTISSGTLTKVDKSKALSIKEYYGNTIQDGTPTPEAPVEIQTISGDNTFTINLNSYRVDLKGKNLLNPFVNHSAGYSTTIRGITFTINQDGTITANGTATGGSATLILYGAWSGTTVYQTLDKTKNYCLPSLGNKQIIFVRTYDNGTFTTYNSNTQRTITNKENIVYFGVEISNGETVENYVFKPQLEEGSEPTPYEPYYNYELCKIGNYQDKLYYNSGKWYIEKNIGKRVFTGASSEDWYYNSPNKGFTITSTFMADRDKTKYMGFCNFFSVNTTSTTWAENNYCGWNASGTFWFKDNGVMATSKADLLIYLSTHNLIVYYVLAEPTTTEITNTTLISELNALYEFYVQSNTVSISNNSEIPLEVLLEYYGR